jgi:superfamily II DNA or RNA helicase/phage anti-repressor protein
MNLYKQIKGNNYELFVLNKLKLQYDEVFFFKFTPERILQHTKLFNNYDIYTKYKNCDIGADLVAVKDNQVYFIQCKNHNNTLCINDLQGFYFLLYEFDLNGIVIYSNEISSRIKDLSNKVQYLHIPYNNQIIDVDYNFLNYIDIQPRDYQIEACNLLKNENRSILSLPSGMGKTFTSYLIAKEYNNIIYIAPLRVLAKQILDQVYDYSNKSYNPILISSDGVRNINCIEQILMDKNLFSVTYDSVDVLINIIDKLDNKIIIIDEFHNLSDNNLNNKNDNMNKILENKNNKILFLSATPIENSKYCGNVIHKYLWNEAIKNKYICDFKIILPVKNEELNKFNDVIVQSEIKNKKLVKKCYFLLKSLLYEGNNKCIVFLTTIEQAQEFNKILLWMQNMLNMELESDMISYNTSKLKRIEIINNFKLSNKRYILLNIHILDEGIDIPECDSIFVIQPNDNILNLVQRMCRCNRITEYKTKCNMLLWCGERKINKILNYISDKTNKELNNKIFKFNIQNYEINKYKINTINNNVLNNNVLNNNNIISENSDNKSNSNLIDFLKTYSKISNKFIDDFFSLYDLDNKNIFIIDLTKVAKWLDSKKGKIKETLLNSYKINIDYTINKTSSNGKKGAPKQEILLTVKCFKLLCMQSRTKKAVEVREYFYALEELIDKYKNYIIEGLKDKIEKLENNQKTKVNPSKGVIYIIQTSDDITLYKIGKTQNLKNRLLKYNTDKKDDIIPIYIYESEDIDAVEKCIKLFMKHYQYRKYKEVYQVNVDIIKQFINKCGDIAEMNLDIHLKEKNKSMKGGDNSNYYIALYR